MPYPLIVRKECWIEILRISLAEDKAVGVVINDLISEGLRGRGIVVPERRARPARGVDERVLSSLRNALRNWDQISERNRGYWLRFAGKHPQLAEAKEILRRMSGKEVKS